MNAYTSLRLALISLACLILWSVNLPARAATLVWTNTAGGDWSTVANWSPNQIPGAADNVYITNNGTYGVALSQYVYAVSNLTLGGISGTQTFDIAGGLVVNGAFTGNANAVVENYDTVQVDLAGGYLNGSGTMNLAGPLYWEASQPGGVDGSVTDDITLTSVTTANALLCCPAGLFSGPVGFTGNQWVNTGNMTICLGPLVLGATSVLSNAPGATVSFALPFANPNHIIPTNGVDGGGTFVNAGELLVSDPGGQDFIQPQFINTGTVVITNDALLTLSGGGTNDSTSIIWGGSTLQTTNFYDFSPASLVTGPGLFAVVGNARLEGLVDCTNFETYSLNSLTVSITGDMAAQSNAFFGNATFTNGATLANSVLIYGGPTVTFNGTGAIQPSSLTMEDGTLAGTDPVLDTGLLTWTGGTISGIVQCQGGLIDNQDNNCYLNGGDLINTGVMTVQGVGLNSATFYTGNGSSVSNAPGATFTFAGFTAGALLTTGNSAFQNAGLLVWTNDQPQSATFQGSLTLNSFFNTGTLVVEPSTNVLNLTLASGGTNQSVITMPTNSSLTLASGTFDFTASSQLSHPQTFNFQTPLGYLDGFFSVGGTVTFNAGTAVVGGVCNLTNAVVISGGTLDLAGTEAVTPASLTMTEGAETNTDPLLVSGALTWTGGSIYGIVEANGGSLNGSLFLYGAVVNSGILIWSNSIYFFGGQLTNQVSGTVNLALGTSANAETGSPSFNNLGQVNISGAGAVNFGIPFNNGGVTTITNNGILNLGDGGSETGWFTLASGSMLNLTENTFNFSAGGSVGGNGLLQISGATANFSGTGNATNSLMLTGTLNLTGASPLTPASATISGGTEEGTQTMQIAASGAFTWTSGTIYGTVQVNGGSLSGSLNLYGALVNSGPLAWSGSIYCFNGQITNQAAGTVTSAPGSALIAENGAPAFINSGKFDVSGTGTVILSMPFNNSGGVLVSNGATLNLSGGGVDTGTFTNYAGTTLQLGGGTFSANPGSVLAGPGNFLVNGGTASLGGTLDITGTNSFSGGMASVTGNGNITNVLLINNGTLNLNGTGTISPVQATISSGTEEGSQTLQVSASGGFFWTGGAIEGTVQCNGGSITGSLNLYGSLLNSGPLAWSGTLYCFGGQFTNQASGTLNATPGASANAENGVPVFINLGQFNDSGTGTVSLNIPFNNGGVVTVTNHGTLELTVGGSETGAFTVASGATLQLASNPVTFSGSGTVGGAGILLISGSTVNFSGTGNATNVLLLNSGTLNLTCASPLTPASFTVGGGTEEGTQIMRVLDAGEFAWTAGSIYGPVQVNGGSLSGNLNLDGALVNTGPLAWSGQMYFYGGQFTNQPSGSVNIAAGTGANAENGAPTINNLGQFNVTSPGTVNLALPFNNAGTINIQSGTLDLSDGVSLANGTLNFDITGATGNGALTVSGNVALTGTLGATFNAYAPQVGDAFTLINYGSKSGAFTGFNVPAGLDFQKTYGASSFTLTLTNIVQFFNVVLAPGQPAFTPAGFNIVVAGPTGSNYTLQVSTNLAKSNWATVTNFTSTTPFTTVFDTNATNIFPGRWYRAVVP